MRRSIDFIDYINDSVRLLIILETSSRIKPTHQITENRIMLYDYYLRFPHTMLRNTLIHDESKANFDEHYAFFHWKPDVIRYRSNLNYLIAKGLIDKCLDGSNLFFVVSPQGIEALQKMKSRYKQRLSNLADGAFPGIIKLSDKRIEEDIAARTNIVSRGMRGKIDEN